MSQGLPEKGSTPDPSPNPYPNPSPYPSVGSTPTAIAADTWQRFCELYATSGKALNDADLCKAAMEAANLNLGEADMIERVVPALEAALTDWANREVRMIPLPTNWIKSQPWTRVAKPRTAPISAAQRKQNGIDEIWTEVRNGNQ
jgi:hypothetical protein